MILFIDQKTGSTYNGNAPYVHWYEGKQSIGLLYDKTFVVLSDSGKLTVNLDSEAFYLVDPNKLAIENISIDGDSFLDLKEITTNTLNLRGIKYTQNGNVYYIFSFSVIANGLYAGQVTENFAINNEVFTLGADFVDENESLSINLANFGQEMHKDIQRAIYEEDIHEQLPNYVLLNRKYKELLNEYINVLGNKGSYKSLVNSLKWFEYGDLVHIYEYWRYNEPNKEYLSKKDIEQFVTERINDMLTIYQKTTYISINYALDSLVKDETGLVFQTLPQYTRSVRSAQKLVPEPNPQLGITLSLWSQQELALKMVLLGNFFATYFMPIHLDMIHCTIENVVYTNCLKILHGSTFDRTDYTLDINEFYCKVDELFHLSNVETYTNINTPFGFIRSNVKEFTDEEDGALTQLGVDTYLDDSQDQETQLITYALQHYKGIGVIVPFKCKLHNVSNGKHITSGTIYVYKNEKLIEKRETTKVGDRQTYIVDNCANIELNILLKEIGNYKVQLEFVRNDGHKYTKVVQFVVDEECYQEIEIYKVVPRYESVSAIPPITKWVEESDNDNAIDVSDIARYVLNPVCEKGPHFYTQFITGSTENDTNVHFNRISILKLKNPVTKRDKNGNPIAYKYDLNHSVDFGILLLDNLVMYSSTFSNSTFADGDTCKREVMNNYINAIVSTTFGTNRVKKSEPAGYAYANCEFFHFIKSSGLVNTNNKDYIASFGGTQYEYIMIIQNKPIVEGGLYYTFTSKNEAELEVYNRICFVPYLYKLEKAGETKFLDELEGITEEEKFRKLISEATYRLNSKDVICFLPKLSEIRKPKVFNWKFTCETTGSEITPISYYTGNEVPTILQPFFGRYDFAKIPDFGYYTVTCNYKMDNTQDEDNSTSISSSFIYDQK